MTSIVTDSVATILAAKRRIHELNSVIPGSLVSTFSFIAAGTGASNLSTAPTGLTAVVSTPGGVLRSDYLRDYLRQQSGFLGYASDLFELRPEHEFLRERVFNSLFGCFCVFETREQSRAAWDKAQAAGTFAGEHVCFLALDTYDEVKLTETLEEGGFQWNWQEAPSSDGVVNPSGNPFIAPETSSMLTADERSNRLHAANSQDVIMFAHRGFRSAASSGAAMTKLAQVKLAREELRESLGRLRDESKNGLR